MKRRKTEYLFSQTALYSLKVNRCAPGTHISIINTLCPPFLPFVSF
uniref:Uncharacterized protein n=1 Tax=Anguilla anguilla TaxID=7936 RepID=A0A0E9RE11_ANGAN